MRDLKPFISFEGIDGLGKSTQVKRLKEFLIERGHDVVATREPGGTSAAEAVRQVLLGQHEEIHPRTEALLLYAGRIQHVEHLIKPALAKKQWVLCDRFFDASFAYQGGGREVGMMEIQKLHDWCQLGIVPTCTILLDGDISLMRSRLADKQLDRLEEEGDAFFERIRQAYLMMAKENPGRYIVLSADQDEQTLHASIITELEQRVGL